MTNLSAHGAGNDRPEPVGGTLAAAAGMTLFVGLLLTVMGLGHLDGVIVTATNKGHAYDFRLAALLLVGIALVFGGALCLSAVRGLAHGRRTAWGRALIGTLLLLLVLVPLIPLQPEMAPGLSVLTALNLIALLLAWSGLEAGTREAPSPSVGVADELAKLAASRDAGTTTSAEFDRQRTLLLASMPPSSSGLRCGRCGQALSRFWRDRCGVCKTPFTEVPPIRSS